MGDCKKIIATTKEPAVSIKNGAKTANSTLKEIEVELKGFGEGYVPDPALFKYNEDRSAISDLIRKEVKRSITDLSSSIDAFYKNIGKGFVETSVASDTVSLLVNWVRNIDDSAGFNDILSVKLSRPLLDQSIATDAISKTVSKAFSETSAASDTFSKILQPASTETALASDVLTALVNFNLSLQDWVYSTDDVLGNANVDDDQYANVSKTILELMTYTDALGIASIKVLSDSGVFTDAFSKSLGIVLADFSPISETVNKSVSISRTELSVMSETRTANLQSYMAESYVDSGYIGTNYII